MPPDALPPLPANPAVAEARALVHALVDALPAALLGPTLALLLAGPRYLCGTTRTTPPPRRPAGPAAPGG